MPQEGAPRQTLAMRMAERRRLRDERAERLARLAVPRPEVAAAAAPEAVPAAPPVSAAVAAPVPAPAAAAAVPLIAPERPLPLIATERPLPLIATERPLPLIATERDAAAALEEFLRSLTRGLDGKADARAEERPAPEAAAVLPFPAREAPSDLERLDGVGPGLLWALRRAGIAALADLAALEPEALIARLGPVGRLVPARAWIATARGLA